MELTSIPFSQISNRHLVDNFCTILSPVQKAVVLLTLTFSSFQMLASHLSKLFLKCHPFQKCMILQQCPICFSCLFNYLYSRTVADHPYFYSLFFSLATAKTLLVFSWPYFFKALLLFFCHSLYNSSQPVHSTIKLYAIFSDWFIAASMHMYSVSCGYATIWRR